MNPLIRVTLSIVAQSRRISPAERLSASKKLKRDFRFDGVLKSKRANHARSAKMNIRLHTSALKRLGFGCTLPTGFRETKGRY
jgi:hypothetical protein